MTRVVQQIPRPAIQCCRTVLCVQNPASADSTECTFDVYIKQPAYIGEFPQRSGSQTITYLRSELQAWDAKI